MTILAICDFDGVLVDLQLDTEAVRARIAALFATEGILGEWTPLLKGIERACATVALQAPARAQSLRERAWSMIDAEELRCAEVCRLRPGACEFLDQLTPYPCAIFSNNRSTTIGRALAHTGIGVEQFVAIVGRTSAESIKPSAQPVLDLIDRHGRPPVDRIVLFGDHPYDMQSALLASAELAKRGDARSVVAIGLPRDRLAGAKLEQAGAWFIADDLEAAVKLALLPSLPSRAQLKEGFRVPN
jgi:phosphoglycolate phosphatase-like HAD superfamily hydrolase